MKVPKNFKEKILYRAGLVDLVKGKFVLNARGRKVLHLKPGEKPSRAWVNELLLRTGLATIEGTKFVLTRKGNSLLQRIMLVEEEVRKRKILERIRKRAKAKKASKEKPSSIVKRKRRPGK
jgi:hypothetical protein